MQDAGLWEYVKLKERWNSHNRVCRKLINDRIDLMKTMEDGEAASVQIQKLVNARESAASGRKSVNEQ